MFNSRLSTISGSVLFALVGATLSAQQTSGSMQGQLRSKSGKPLQGVTIRIQSPALFQPRLAVTDAKGEWRAMLLPVGDYVVSAAKEGYNETRTPQVRLGLGVSLRVDLEMAEIQSAVVEVTATSAAMDKSDTKAGTNYSAAQLETLAVSDRGFFGATDLAPGTVRSSSGNPVFRGGSTINSNYRINGAEVKEELSNSLSTTRWMIADNVEDVQVVTSQVNVRYGRSLGGSTNVVTKSGSNRFEGSIRAILGRESWTARTAAMKANTVLSDTLNREYNVTFRGPILRDRLWFALGTILVPSTRSSNLTFSTATPPPGNTITPLLTRNANIDSQILAGPGPGYSFAQFPGTSYTSTNDSTYVEGKITGAINSEHTLEFSFVSQNSSTSPADAWGYAVRQSQLGKQETTQNMRGLLYRGLLSNNAFLEGRLTQMKQTSRTPNGDPAMGGGIEALYVYTGLSNVPGRTSGNYQPGGFDTSQRKEINESVSGGLNFKLMVEAAGTHDLDMGVEYYQYILNLARNAGSRDLIFRASGAFINDAGNYMFPVINFTGRSALGQLDYSYMIPGPAPTVTQNLGVDARSTSIQRGYYINDTWTINPQWLMSAGVRMDRSSLSEETGQVSASSSDPTYSAMLRWDPKGDSSHLVTLTAAHFAGAFNMSFARAFMPASPMLRVLRGWNANSAAPGATDDGGRYGVRFVDYRELVRLENYGTVIQFDDLTKQVKVDSDLKAPSMEEITLSYRRSYKGGSNFSATFVHRNWLDTWATEAVWDSAYVVTLADPTGSGLPSQQKLRWRTFNSSDLKREYNALELSWLRVFSPRWTMSGSYTYSRLTGNNNDGDSLTSTYRNIMPDPYYNYRAQIAAMGRGEADVAPQGLLVNHQANKARLSLTHVIPVKATGNVTLSALLSYDSGGVFSAAVAAPFNPTVFSNLGSQYSNFRSYPSMAYTQFYGPRGAYETTGTYNMDFKLSWDVPTALWKCRLIGDLFVSNVANRQMARGADTAFSSTSMGTTQLMLGNPATFYSAQLAPGQGGYFIPGRSAKLTVGLRF